MYEDESCPYCGRPYGPPSYSPRPLPLPSRHHKVRRAHFGSGNLADVSFSVAEYLQPARSAAVASDVSVPLLQAIVSGLVAGLVSIAPAIIWHWYWYIPVAIGFVAFGVIWFVLLAEHRKLLWYSERIEGTPEVITPDPPRVGVRLEVDEGDGHHKYARLPIEKDKLCTIARALKNGRTFSMGAWTGKGKLLSRREFEDLRSWLIDNRYAYWVDPNNRQLGVNFSNKGRALWRALAAS